MDASATVSIGFRFIAWLLPWLMIRCFPDRKLDELLEVYPSPIGDSIDIYFPSRRATCWLQFVNLTPFRLRIDRLEVKVVVGSLGVLMRKVLPEDIPSLGRAKLFCEDSFDADPAVVAHAAKENKARIEIRGFIVCGSRSFSFSRNFQDLRGFRVNG